MISDFESLVDEYFASGQFALLDGPAKKHAETLLPAFALACRARPLSSSGDFSVVDLEAVLFEHIARSNTPLAVRQAAPGLLKEFFGYLAESGRYPPAAEWARWVSSLEGRYCSLFRGDGSLRGETYRKKYSDVNRNDPCPCGSGKKFKKCCMGLIV